MKMNDISPNYGNFMADCIHLKACRRMSKKARLNGSPFGRGCDESCTAYVCGDDEQYITIDEAIDYARSGESSIRSGYDSYDVYARQDLCGMTLKQLIDELEESAYEDDYI